MRGKSRARGDYRRRPAGGLARRRPCQRPRPAARAAPWRPRPPSRARRRRRAPARRCGRSARCSGRRAASSRWPRRRRGRAGSARLERRALEEPADHLGRFLVVDGGDDHPLRPRSPPWLERRHLRRHGSHQVAQKLSTTTWPASASSLHGLPSRSATSRRRGPGRRPGANDVGGGSERHGSASEAPSAAARPAQPRRAGRRRGARLRAHRCILGDPAVRCAARPDRPLARPFPTDDRFQIAPLLPDRLADAGPRDAARAALSATPASVAPKFFYDALGSRLFEAITELAEYYPTRTEAAIFAAHGAEHRDGDRPRRDADRSRRRQLRQGGTPVHAAASRALRRGRHLGRVPARGAAPAAARASRRSRSSASARTSRSRLDAARRGSTTAAPLFFYPGSSIGNFTPDEALAFLRRRAREAAGGGLLIGVDLVKPGRARGRLRRRARRHRGVQPATAAPPQPPDRQRLRPRASGGTSPSSTRPRSRIEMHLEARATLGCAGRAATRASPRASASTPRTPTSTRPTASPRCCADAGFARTRLDRPARLVRASSGRRRAEEPPARQCSARKRTTRSRDARQAAALPPT